VDLAQLVRFLVVELTHSSLNPRFDVDVVFKSNYFLVGGDVSIDNEILLVNDFMNLKIKPTQSFRGVHRDRVCVRVFIEMGTRTYISIYICTIFINY
jgi:hypothetical protein